MEDAYLARSAERTLRILELVLAHPEGLSAQVLAAETGFSRSSLFMLLKTLKTLGYLDQTEKRGRYLPGPRLLAWQARGDLNQQDLMAAFYQEVASRSWPETVALLIPVSGGVIPLAQVEGDYETRRVFNLGRLYSNLRAAEMLFAPEPGLISEGEPILINTGETLDLAAPICPDGVHPRAALMLSALPHRWDAEALKISLGFELMSLAARISFRLGASHYAPFHGLSPESLQPLEALSEDQMDVFLRSPVSARLACLRPDGSPHVIPLWQEWDGKAFTVIAWQGSHWPEYVLQNPAVSLTVDEPWPPLRRVVARGQARPLDNLKPGDLERLVNRLARRYLGRDLGEWYLQQVDRAFRIEVDLLRGWQGLAQTSGSN